MKPIEKVLLTLVISITIYYVLAYITMLIAGVFYGVYLHFPGTYNWIK